MYFDVNEYYFYWVAMEKNITKAARQVHVSQPALSKAMTRLEEKIGCQLLVRTPQGIELTQAGQVLFDGVKAGMSVMDETVSRISKISLSDVGKVTIGSGDDLFTYFMIPVLLKYHAIYPNIVVRELMYLNSDHIINGVLSKEIDIGLTNKRIDHDKLKFMKIATLHEAVLAGERYAALARVGPLKWKELEKLPVVMHCRNTHTRKLLDQQLENMGVHLRAAMEVGSTACLMEAAMQNYGLSIVTREIAQMDYRYPSLTEIPMETQLQGRETYVCWNRDVKMEQCLGNLLELVMESKGDE